MDLLSFYTGLDAGSDPTDHALAVLTAARPHRRPTGLPCMAAASLVKYDAPILITAARDKGKGEGERATTCGATTTPVTGPAIESLPSQTSSFAAT